MRLSGYIVLAFLLLFPSVASAQGNGGKASLHAVQNCFQPGQQVPESMIKDNGYRRFFTIEDIPDTIFARMQGKSYKTDCPIKRQTLRYLRCLHRNAEGCAIVGEMVVNEKIASKVLDIFQKLFEGNYPIERMRLIDYWNADDENAMRDNNSSGFNFRYISHTKKVSKHGYGLAVDINPLYNPYYKLVNGKKVVEPLSGERYLNRSLRSPYMIKKGDLCHRLFIENGFRWGGDWKSCKDYQHFEM